MRSIQRAVRPAGGRLRTLAGHGADVLRGVRGRRAAAPLRRLATPPRRDRAGRAQGARQAIVDSIFRATGITFGVAGREEGLERTWPMDIVPRIIPAHEWDVIEAGLIQRVTALEPVPRRPLRRRAGDHRRRDRALRWLVESAGGYLREAHGIPATKGARCVVAGIDLVRDSEGTYRVLEDNLRVPSGVSYVLENRLAMERVLPTAFAHQRCAR